MDRRNVLRLLASSAGLSAISCSKLGNFPFLSSSEQSDVNSLAYKYRDFFPIGAAVNTSTIRTHKDLIISQFNSITAENEMKFESIHPQEDLYNFEPADEIVNFAVEHNMQLRGHCFVWQRQNPAWLFIDGSGNPVSKELLFERLEQHISTVINRYKNRIFCWDVVNEAISGQQAQFFRDTKWLQIAGLDYIAEAFKYAHAADPNALLFYNDYNEINPIKRAKIISLIKSLLQQGVPLHGIGLQCHWSIQSTHPEEIRRTIDEFAALGLKIHITELDLSMYALTDYITRLDQPTTEMIETQAIIYESAFAIFRQYKDVITNVTFWGASDEVSWRNDTPEGKRPSWPLLFDSSQQPKEVFNRVMKF